MILHVTYPYVCHRAPSCYVVIGGGGGGGGGHAYLNSPCKAFSNGLTTVLAYSSPCYFLCVYTSVVQFPSCEVLHVNFSLLMGAKGMQMEPA